MAGQAQARSTLRRYGVLDDRITFVPGYFNESLPPEQATAFALVHIDADAYDSVMDALDRLYSRISPGGYVVVDDFHLPGVRAAVMDFRNKVGITAPLLPVPSDHVTACSPDWSVADQLLVHPLTVAYWKRGMAKDLSGGGKEAGFDPVTPSSSRACGKSALESCDSYTLTQISREVERRRVAESLQG